MGYLIFVPKLGWVTYVKKDKKNGGFTVLYTWDRDKAYIYWTYLGAKRAAKKVSNFSEIVELVKE